MKDRADYMSRKAGRTSNPALTTAIAQLAPQIDAAYTNQVRLEGSAQNALSQVTAIQQGGGGVSFAAMLSAAKSILSTAGDIALHERKVAGIDSLLRQLESKTLTSAEIAQLRAGGGMFGAAGAVMLGAVAIGLFLIFRGKKR